MTGLYPPVPSLEGVIVPVGHVGVLLQISVLHALIGQGMGHHSH